MIQNIWAVGRNYVEHAKELGNESPRGDDDPIIFLKAGSSIVPNEGRFKLPKFSSDIHHECEVAFRFGPSLNFEEMTLAIDLTAREVQTKLKSAGHPWTLAKSFKSSCPIGPFVKVAENPQAIQFILKVNGEIRQRGQTGDMVHTVEKLRLYVIDRFPVVPGDLLLTGTPKGVARLMPGDRLEAEISDVLKAIWHVDL